jgi:hypothetical protein
MAESCKEGHGSKRAVFPLMMMMIGNMRSTYVMCGKNREYLNCGGESTRTYDSYEM